MRIVINIVLVFIFILSYLDSNCQYKNDKWIIGIQPDIVMEFGKDSTTNKIYTTDNIIKYRGAVANINDSNGIIFSSNGSKIFNKLVQKMDNSDYILPQKFADYIGASNYSQQTIILPKKENQFYVVNCGISDNVMDSITSGLTAGRIDILTYSIVDMSENNGSGKVISKMNYLLEHDTLSACQMSAVRHANGRDWWLVKPHAYKHRFYTFLVTPDGIIPQPIQEFASPTFTNGVNGQSNFSLDGSLYVMTSTFDSEYTQVNYFDRCTGKMTNYKSIKRMFDSTHSDFAKISGAAFSPNNRFVYLINNLHIVQYELSTDERIELEIDGFSNPAGNTVAYNASDGRIYIGNYDGTGNYFSYIEFPDKKGLAAGYCRMCYKTKNFNTKTPPNMPNYELGALIGSPCDTIKPYVEPPPPQPTTLLNILIPNAFSPNGDGKNDTWHILNVPQLQLAGITLQAVGVYNRWGNEVFKSSDINFSWDAKGCVSDSYYYYIRYRTQAGTSQVQKGSVNLVR